MNIKLGQLVASNEALQRLFSKELPARTAFLLGKAAKAVGAELQAYFETHNKLVIKYGSHDDATEQVRVLETSPQWKPFREELEELLATDTEIAVCEIPLKLIETVTMTTADSLALDWLIRDDSGQVPDASEAKDKAAPPAAEPAEAQAMASSG